MFGLTHDSTLKEVENVFDSLSFEVEFTEGNGDGCYVAYCREDPTHYFMADNQEDALYGVMSEVDAALHEFIGYKLYNIEDWDVV